MTKLIKSFAKAWGIAICGAALITFAMSSTSEPTESTDTFLRVGTTSKFMVDIDKTSIKVDWNEKHLFYRDITFTMKAILHKAMDVTVSDGSSRHITHFLNRVVVKCSDESATLTRSILFSGDNKAIDVSVLHGPLSEWMEFGVDESSQITDIFCDAPKKLVKPVTA